MILIGMLHLNDPERVFLWGEGLAEAVGSSPWTIPIIDDAWRPYPGDTGSMAL